MSKTLSLDTKTIYQLQLGIIAAISLLVIILAFVQLFGFNYQPPQQPLAKPREQQLKTAIELIQKPIN